MAYSGENNDIIKSKAKINGREIEVSLDSGTTTSVISNSIAKAWNLKVNTSSNYIETSSGKLIQVIGRTEDIIVEFEGLLATISFLITNIKVVNVLLGVDWFKQTGVTLDPKNSKFLLPISKTAQITAKRIAGQQDKFFQSMPTKNYSIEDKGLAAIMKLFEPNESYITHEDVRVFSRGVFVTL